LFKVSDPTERRGNTLTAREILEKGAQDIARSLNDQPDVQARLQGTIGVVYTNIGMYSEAESLLRGAVDTQQRTLGVSHAETLSSLHALANVYWYLDRLKEAQDRYSDVIKHREQLLGVDHPDTLKAKYDLASVYMSWGDWNDAERLAVIVLKEAEQLNLNAYKTLIASFGPENARSQRAVRQLVALYEMWQKPPEAAHWRGKLPKQK
jgi:tetratricopeptide (TPR) repeat protein